MATHSSVLAWRIPGTEEPSGLPSMPVYGVAQSRTRPKCFLKNKIKTDYYHRQAVKELSKDKFKKGK